jgi:hypothetical protein
MILIKYQKLSFQRYLHEHRFAGAERYIYPWSYFVIIARIIVNTLFIIGKKETDYFFVFNTINYGYLLLLWTILPVFITIGSFRDVHLNIYRMKLLPLREVDVFIYENLSIFLHPFFYLLLCLNIIIFYPAFYNNFSFFALLNYLFYILFMISYVVLLINVIIKRYQDAENKTIISNIFKLIPFLLVIMNYQYIIIDGAPALVLFNVKYQLNIIYNSSFWTVLMNNSLSDKPSAITTLILFTVSVINFSISYLLYSRKKHYLRNKSKRLRPLKYIKKRLLANLKSRVYFEYKIVIYKKYLSLIILLSAIISIYLYYHNAIGIVYIIAYVLFFLLTYKYPFNSISGIASVRRYFLLPISYHKMISSKNYLFLIMVALTMIPLEIGCILGKNYTEAFMVGINSIYSFFMFCLAGNIISIYTPSGRKENNFALLLALLIVTFPVVLYYKILSESIVAYSVTMVLLIITILVIYKKMFLSIGKAIEEECENILQA